MEERTRQTGLRKFAGFGGFAAALLAVNLAALLLRPAREPVLPPRQPAQPQTLRAELAAQDPQVVLLGPARLTAQLNPQALAGALGQRVVQLTAKRAGPAWLYLAVKNVLPAGRTAVILFSGWQLTFPEYAADSGRADLTYLLTEAEPEVERLAYSGRMPRAEFFLRRTWPLYDCRTDVANTAEDWFSPSPLAEVYGRERQYGPWRTAHDRAAEQARRKYDNRMWDFTQEAQESFLPLILRECARREVRAVFLELPGTGEPEDAPAREYRAALREYLRAAGGEYFPALHYAPQTLDAAVAEFLRRPR